MQVRRCLLLLERHFKHQIWSHVKLSYYTKTGEEQLHIAADRRAEQTEGASRAATEEEEDQKYSYYRAQRPEDN